MPAAVIVVFEKNWTAMTETSLVVRNRLFGYARGSTEDQDLRLQIDACYGLVLRRMTSSRTNFLARK